MCPVLLLFQLFAALSSESAANPPEDNTGLKFIVVFPENIAYYHPSLPKNKVKITALHDNTEVSIIPYIYPSRKVIMHSGQCTEIACKENLELRKGNNANKTLTIISTKKIAIQAISLKDNSVQTALVTPTEKLGKMYFVPQIPKIQGTTDQVTLGVTERSPFRLVIISADQDTKVTVEGAEAKEVLLQPRHILQILVQEGDKVRAVKADQPVAVLFAHSCAIWRKCTCGLLYAMLPPAKEEKLTFFVPPVLAKDAKAETFLLLSDKESTKAEAFDPDSPPVETAGTAILYRPGLLLTLIPEMDFASCFVVSNISEMQTMAVIVVHENFTDGVRIGRLPPQSSKWQELKGTEYVSTEVNVVLEKTVIWHTSYKMGVYFRGNKGEVLFGNPAPIISRAPDFRGCVLTPEVVKIGEVAGGWRESLKYCEDENLELVSISNAQHRTQIYEKIIRAKNETVQEVWIGLRRSSQTGDWYWINNDPLTDTNWEAGEPGTAHDGQCAIMNLESGKDFGWSDEDCCRAAHPVCYRKPVLLPLL